MRLTILLILLSIAGTVHAEDPLESLNSVEETVSTMHHALQSKAVISANAAPGPGGLAGAGDNPSARQELYFLSDEPLGGAGWVMVTPCTPEEATAADDDSGTCGSPAEEGKFDAKHLWKSRPAAAQDLRVGLMVIAKDKARGGEWYLAKITDASDLNSGYVSISAPFRAEVKNLTVVEE